MTLANKFVQSRFRDAQIVTGFLDIEPRLGGGLVLTHGGTLFYLI